MEPKWTIFVQGNLKTNKNHHYGTPAKKGQRFPLSAIANSNAATAELAAEAVAAAQDAHIVGEPVQSGPQRLDWTAAYGQREDDVIHIGIVPYNAEMERRFGRLI